MRFSTVQLGIYAESVSRGRLFIDFWAGESLNLKKQFSFLPSSDDINAFSLSFE